MLIFGRLFVPLKSSMTSILKLQSSVKSVTELSSTALDYLIRDEVVAVPTDTIYGFAALAQNPVAVDKLYQLKNRSLQKPIAICVADIDDIPRWAEVTVSQDVLKALLPGPVTILMKRTSLLNPQLNPSCSLVGIRIPNYPFIRNLCTVCHGPLALTSANTSSDMSSLKITEFKHLWPQLALLIDGGKLSEKEEARQGSTVVDLSIKGYFKITRKGIAYQDTKAKLTRFCLTEVEERSAEALAV